MKEEEILTKKPATFINTSVTLKIMTIAFLILLLLIPTFMIESLMQEREQRKNDVIFEISDKWGQEQTIAGPILIIPYKQYYKDEKGLDKYSVSYAHFLPAELDISGKLNTEIRYRSIYETVLYNTQLTLAGSFDYPNLEEFSIPEEDVIWNRVSLNFGITDMKGIKDTIDVVVNGQTLTVSPGLEYQGVLTSGVSSRLALPPAGEQINFQYSLNLNGSQQINFIPVGKITNVALSSSWPGPSFTGTFLPANRTITKEGFTANWKILHLNRNYPQSWTIQDYNIYDSAFGVKLVIAADLYQQAERTMKYAIMFIVFTFTAFFISEITSRKRLHPVQYLLIGLAVVIFYILLISISEHTNFDIAYIISSVSVILLITAYSKSILNNKYFTITVFGILTILYAYMYIVLQLEDYALLMGSVGLFIVLSSVMYLTRKLDWYALNFTE